MDLRPRLLALDCFHHVHRDAFVFLAKMHLDRASRLFVGELSDCTAVIANRRRKSLNSASGEEGGSTAHAITDDSNRARHLQDLTDCGDTAHHMRPNKAHADD